MIEFLLIGLGGPSRTYPNSGPGPSTLIKGDDTFGYFGPVPSGTMYDRSELVTQLPLPSATPYLPTAGQSWQWFKFVSNGKIIFVPSLPLYTGASWSAVYAQGYMYGTNNNGTVPDSPAVKQKKTVFIQDASTQAVTAFNVRSFSGAQSDPLVGQFGQNLVGPNEFDKFTQMLPTMPSGAGATLYNLIPAHITYTTFNTTYFVGHYCASTNGLAAISQLLKTAANMAWRPVLELIPTSTMAIAPQVIYGGAEVQIAPFILDVKPFDVIKSPGTVYATQDGMTRPLLYSVTPA